MLIGVYQELNTYLWDWTIDDTVCSERNECMNNLVFVCLTFTTYVCHFFCSVVTQIVYYEKMYSPLITSFSTGRSTVRITSLGRSTVFKTSTGQGFLQTNKGEIFFICTIRSQKSLEAESVTHLRNWSFNWSINDTNLLHRSVLVDYLLNRSILVNLKNTRDCSLGRVNFFLVKLRFHYVYV